MDGQVIMAVTGRRERARPPVGRQPAIHAPSLPAFVGAARLPRRHCLLERLLPCRGAESPQRLVACGVPLFRPAFPGPRQNADLDAVEAGAGDFVAEDRELGRGHAAFS